MPKLALPAAEHAAAIRASGFNPDDYLLDEESGEFVPKAEVPVNPITEAGKGLVRGAASGLLAIPEAAGMVADAIRGATGTYDPKNPSLLTSGPKKLKEWLGEKLPADPRDPFFSSSIGEGAGNLATILASGPERLLGKGGAIALGATGAGVNAAERERMRQEREGYSDPQQTLARSSMVGAANIPLMMIGPGKLLGNLETVAPTAAEIGKRALVNAGLGAASGAGGSAVEQGIVEHDLNPAEFGKAALVGGLLQAGTGGALDVANRHFNAPKVAPSIRDSKAPVAAETVAPPVAEFALDATKKAAMLSRYNKGQTYEGAISTPVDKAANTLFELGVPIDEGLLDTLATTWGGKQSNQKALDQLVDKLGDQHIMQQPAEPLTPAEIADERLKFSKEQDDGWKRAHAEDKAIEARSKQLAEMSPGDAWKSGIQAELTQRRKSNEEFKAMLVNRGRTLDMTEKMPEIPESTGPEASPFSPTMQEPAGSLLSQQTEGPMPVQQELPLAPETGPMSLQDYLSPRAKEAPLPEILQKYRQLQEGEQGLPFSAEETPAEVKAKRSAELDNVIEPPRIYEHIPVPESLAKVEEATSQRPQEFYSGLPPKLILKAARDLGVEPGNALKKLVESTSERMAKLSPGGALFSSLYHSMFKERYRLQAEGVLPLADRLKFTNKERSNLLDPAIVEWLHKQTDNKTWNVEELPKHLQETGAFIKDLILKPHENQRSAEIGVERIDRAGNRTVDHAADVGGYFPWEISDKVRRAAEEGGPAWEKYRQAWLRDWENTHNTSDPNWAEDADAALRNLFPTILTSNRSGGEPLFSAVRRAHGIPLPREFRSDDIVHGLQRYYDRYSADMAYGKIVQKNPVMRRVLGLEEDPMGRPTKDTDPVSWKEAPLEWKEAVREGKLAGAEWAVNADENNPPDAPIETIKGNKASELADIMMASYRQTPLADTTGGRAAQTLSALTQLGGAVLLQTPSGIRDVGTAISNTYRDAGFRNTIKGIVATASKGGIRRAMEAGAMQHDPFTAQMPVIDSGDSAHHWINRALIKTARAVRAATGRQFLDNYSRAIGYNAVYEAIMAGEGDHFVKAMGPVDQSGMTREQIAEATASRFSTIISNPADARTLPPMFVPQTQNFVGQMFGLSRFGVAQLNNFITHAYKPALNGKIGPLVRTLVGSTLTGAAAGALINALTNSKPEHLTWAEWLKLPKEEDKIKEFFFTWLGYDRAIGSMGILSDLLYPTAKRAAGGKVRPADFAPQNAGWIVAADMWQKLLNFNKSLATSWTSPKDIMELAWSLAKSQQNIRALSNWTEEKKAFRDHATYERLMKRSAQSGKALGPVVEDGVVIPPNEFSMEKMFWGADTKEDWKKLQPMLQEIVKAKGMDGLPKLSKWTQDAKYYRWVGENYGADEMKKQLIRDKTKDAEGQQRERLMRATAMGKW